MNSIRPSLPSRRHLHGSALLAVLAILLFLGAIAFVSYRVWNRAQASHVEYPYWCSRCKAVFDVSELKKDYPKNWRIPKGSPSDSIVLCLRCDEGWAYPAAICYQCDTRYLLHIMPRTECPTCYPEFARLASERNLNLTPPELSDND